MKREEAIALLLEEAYKTEKINLYDTCFKLFSNQNGEHFPNCKEYADELIEEKLAKFIDDKKTMFEITNYGKFWMLKGGYLEYLLRSEKKIKHRIEIIEKEHLEEELLEARLKFTRYRIKTYWISFIFSMLSFIFSLLSLYLVFNHK